MIRLVRSLGLGAILIQSKSRMSKLPATREHLQGLLDEEMKIAGEISNIDEEIERYEDLVLGQGWTQGNIKVGWTKGDVFAGKMSTSLLNRDRIFSLSSITSYVSQHLNSIENEKTTPHDYTRFYKKKKKVEKKNAQYTVSKSHLNRSNQRRGRPRKHHKR